MTAKLVVGSVCAGVFLGALLTPSHTPDPQVQVKYKFLVVHTPAKVYTRKVPAEIIKSPPVVTPMPQSCESVITEVKNSTASANKVYSNANKFFVYIDRMELRKMENPVTAYPLREWLSNRQEMVRSDVQALAEDVSALDASWGACQKAVEKAKQDAQSAAADN